MNLSINFVAVCVFAVVAGRRYYDYSSINHHSDSDCDARKRHQIKEESGTQNVIQYSQEGSAAGFMDLTLTATIATMSGRQR